MSSSGIRSPFLALASFNSSRIRKGNVAIVMQYEASRAAELNLPGSDGLRWTDWRLEGSTREEEEPR